MEKNIKIPVAEKPVIGITTGDLNGIGPEVIVKALADNRILKHFTPILYGSTKIFSFYKKLLNLEEFNYNHVKLPGAINHKNINVVNCWEEAVEIKPGEVSAEGGKYAFLSLKKATEDLKNGVIEGIVTGPINKNSIQSDEFKFPGHTEYFTETFGAQDSLMLLVADEFRVGVVTGHIPLKDVSNSLTKEKIVSKLKLLQQSLKNDFGITKPRIAVLGLNPHAGEEGLLGEEEKNIIKPAMEEAKSKGILVFGPYPSDGFFGMMLHSRFDGILAMYHDQGLIPFKTLAFEKGVNYTAGIPVVRTSPDHGTAFNIAGKNLANETSMREAMLLAAEICKVHHENHADPKSF